LGGTHSRATDELQPPPYRVDEDKRPHRHSPQAASAPDRRLLRKHHMRSHCRSGWGRDLDREPRPPTRPRHQASAKSRGTIAAERSSRPARAPTASPAAHLQITAPRDTLCCHLTMPFLNERGSARRGANATMRAHEHAKPNISITSGSTPPTHWPKHLDRQREKARGATRTVRGKQRPTPKARHPADRPTPPCEREDRSDCHNGAIDARGRLQRGARAEQAHSCERSRMPRIRLR